MLNYLKDSQIRHLLFLMVHVHREGTPLNFRICQTLNL
jgi:hypothetical protein